MNKIINIEKANYLNEYKIHFEFNDGVETTVDFKNFIFMTYMKEKFNRPDNKT